MLKQSLWAVIVVFIAWSLLDFLIHSVLLQSTMPIRLAQVGSLGYDGGHVRLPSDSVGISTHLP